ncbi:hypothetical protein SAMN04487820_102464 [Actinopolyspora mzabensis]|uniref:Uncharacterized protein n=1 Tax=Actinopolyspora mzabensis TaxID=995066 RepID=A0A1G8XAB4_ACTMZ|nr:hypothetical protein [Actinopolyspora mzabensis]SDJ87256.1 hypothetical protein SAMN04487820_102464 [Actinopolyspora mzabensis]
MTTTALSCGNIEREARPARADVRWFDLPPQPSRTDVDPLLLEAEGRVVVHGTDADLAAVVLRLLRKNLLAELSVGYVPVTRSPASSVWSLPVGEFDTALAAPARATPLIRDDSGGVLLGRGAIAPMTGQVYCDDQRMLHGSARSVEVFPDPHAPPLSEPTDDPLATQPAPVTTGLMTVVTTRKLLRQRRESARGRAMQASFEETTVHRDGVAHPRPLHRCAWYRHTRDLLLARP